MLGQAWAEDKASCWNNPDERFIKFVRELFSEANEKLNEKIQGLTLLSLCNLPLIDLSVHF